MDGSTWGLLALTLAFLGFSVVLIALLSSELDRRNWLAEWRRKWAATDV